jgi:hypothetical protein
VDAFVHYRHQYSLPCAVIDIGLVGDMGYIMENPAVYEKFRTAGSYFVGEKEVLASFQWAMHNSSPESKSLGRLSMGVRTLKPLSSPDNHLPWARDRRMAIYHNLNVEEDFEDSVSGDELKSFITQIRADPTVLNTPNALELITKEIGARLYSALLKPVEEINYSQRLQDLGVDSLTMIEMRNWSKRSLGGIEVSTLEFINAGTIKDLGILAINSLKKKYQKDNKDGTAKSEKDTALFVGVVSREDVLSKTGKDSNLVDKVSEARD